MIECIAPFSGGRDENIKVIGKTLLAGEISHPERSDLLLEPALQRIGRGIQQLNLHGMPGFLGSVRKQSQPYPRIGNRIEHVGKQIAKHDQRT